MKKLRFDLLVSLLEMDGNWLALGNPAHCVELQ